MFKQGKYAEAETLALRVIEISPQYGFGWKVLGAIFNVQGHAEKSLNAILKAATLLPNDPETHNILGVTLKNLCRLEEAEASYRRALNIKSDYAEAHNNLGNTLHALGRFEEAGVSCRNALKIKPDYAEAHNNLGNTLHALGRFEEAGVSYRHALEINPDYTEAHSNLGAALNELGLFQEAEACHRRALEITPNYAEAHTNLGYTLQKIGRLDESEVWHRRALEIKPVFAEAHNNLGDTLKDFGRFDEAEACYSRALEIKPDYEKARSNLLFTLNYTTTHTPSHCLEEARRYGKLVSQLAQTPFSSWSCSKYPERLRVGLVSGDLRQHPVGYFLESLLQQIDPSRIELFAYPTHLKDDVLTDRIRSCFSAWKPLMGLTDEASAHLIHEDGIHLLLDLSGHTAHNRLPMFAWRPAPVQVTWLGYFATTGVQEIDYLLADYVGVPEMHHSHFSESVWYLPDTRLCFTPPADDLPVNHLPALQNGFLTYGCFQNLAKVNDAVLMVWKDILAVQPTARLHLQNKQLGEQTIQKQLTQRLEQHGIDTTRVTMYGPVSRTDYLAAYRNIDIMLDTFPYPGGTTTCEALWMGVPTLTLAGDRMLARQGASLLTAAGLPTWVATNTDEYISKATAVANSLPQLADLRLRLRQQVLSSSLFDAPRFARNFEKALWGIWKQSQKQ